MRRPAPAVLAALLLPALAGCTAPAPAPEGLEAGADALAGLVAEGAEVSRSAGEVRFAWQGELFLGEGPLLAPSTAYHPFLVGPGVGTVVAEATAGEALMVRVRDGDGGLVCQGEGREARCDSSAPPALAGREQWTLEVIALTSPSAFGIAPPPAPMAYAAQVTLRAGAPEPLGDLEAGLDPAVRFRTSPTGTQGGEPTIGVTASGAILTVAGTTVLRSRDDGASWEDVTPPLNRLMTLDPFLYVDQRTGRTLVTHLMPTLAHSWLSWSDDEGASWLEQPLGAPFPLQDHQKITVGGHPGPVAAPYDGAIYYSENEAWSRLAINRTALVVLRSLDGGATFTPSVAHTSEQGDYRTGGSVMADLEGNVYVPMYLRPWAGGGVAVAVSHDHGLTWSTVLVAERNGMGNLGIDPDIAIDDAGNVYLAWEGGEEKGAFLSVSRDRGETWSAPQRVSPEGVRSVRFVAAIAGEDGKVAVAYYGTPDSARDSNYVPSWARWHMYVTLAEDALAPQPAWRTARTTALDDPAQLGAICTRGISCTGGRNLADFIDASLTPDGRVVVTYTDGCPATCLTGAESDEGWVHVAVQDEGPRLRGPAQERTNLATAASLRPARA